MAKTDTPSARTLVLVEDSRTQGLRLQAVLEQAGLAVVLARTGQEGLREAQARLPDAIILDVELPDMNGFQVCLGLKAQETTAKIPVIMLTRYDDNLAAIRSLESGAVEFIPKDVFADAVLLESLRQMGVLAAGPSEPAKVP